MSFWRRLAQKKTASIHLSAAQKCVPDIIRTEIGSKAIKEKMFLKLFEHYYYDNKII